MTSPQQGRAIAFILVGELCFGFSSVLIKLCSFPPTVIAAFRMILAGVAITPFCLGALHRLRRQRGVRGLLLLAAPGAILGLHFQVWVIGLKMTSVASASFLISINPVFFAIFERFLYGRRPAWYTWVSLVMVVAGSYWLFSLRGGRLGRLGDLLCLLAGLLFVTYLLFSRRVSAGVPHLPYIQLIYLWGGIVTLPVALLGIGGAAAGPLGDLGGLRLADTGSLLALVALALFPTLVGHTSNNYGVRHLSPLTVSFFGLAEPILATVTAALILGEAPAAQQLPAYGLLLTATVFYLLFSRRDRAPALWEQKA
jgi:drug/metabolite transporter (DMT)-like permease